MSSRGLTFASLPALGLPALSGLPQLGAEMGHDSAWVAETTGTEAFSALAQIAGTAPSLGLGTGVLALQLRSPALAAMGAATLSAGGAPAVYLGVGISSPVVVGRWHGSSSGDRPVARVREYLQLVGALNELMLRAAGELARRDLFSYAVVPASARAFVRAGFADEVNACMAAHAARDRAGALAAISDRMIDAIDICGDAALVRAAVTAYEAAGVDHSVIMPLPWGDNRNQTTIDTLEACRPS